MSETTLHQATDGREKTMQEKEHVLCMRLRKGDKGGDRGLGRARDRERERTLRIQSSG